MEPFRTSCGASVIQLAIETSWLEPDSGEKAQLFQVEESVKQNRVQKNQNTLEQILRAMLTVLNQQDS